jgi:hypothetical protein
MAEVTAMRVAVDMNAAGKRNADQKSACDHHACERPPDGLKPLSRHHIGFLILTQHVTASRSRAHRELKRFRHGIEPSRLEPFLSTYGFRLKDHEDSPNLEKLYFQNSNGQIVLQINGTQCLVAAGRS